MRHDLVQNASGRAAFLDIVVGGIGLAAGKYLHDLHVADKRPFVQNVVQIDTDPTTASYVDLQVCIGLNEVDLDAIQCNLGKFDPIVGLIVEQFGDFLHPEDIGHGSRTVRALTQLAFLYHKPNIVRKLRQAILALKHEGGFEYIQPVLISSSGGGAGSALQILIAQALLDPGFKLALTEGLAPGTLRTPISFVVEPFAYTEKHQTVHADKILGNAFAYRVESDLIERQKGFKYIFHLGLANESGTVLDQPADIAKVLGTSVYQFQRHWPDIKPRTVDTIDSHAICARYTGEDVLTRVALHGNGQVHI